jgi:hypothetical protein
MSSFRFWRIGGFEQSGLLSIGGSGLLSIGGSGSFCGRYREVSLYLLEAYLVLLLHFSCLCHSLYHY